MQHDVTRPGGSAPAVMPGGGAREPDERPLRILCLGGEDHHLRLPFLLALRAQGFMVEAAGSGSPADFVSHGIPFHPFAFPRGLSPAKDRRAVATLRALVRHVAPDVVQSFDTKPNLYLAMAGASLPSCRMVRTINGMGRIYSSSSLAARCLRSIYRMVHRRAARTGAVTVFQNTADKAFFERHGLASATSAHLIEGSGIDVDLFDSLRLRRGAEQPSAAAVLRRQCGLRASRIVVTVMRIEPLKGIRTLLAAAELVGRVEPDVQFLLVGPWEGSGPADRALRERCRSAPNLRWIGPRADVLDLMALADLFVLPTEFREGLPRVLLEAGLTGLPVITTDMPGCLSVVRHGENGLIVPPRSPGALAVSILDLLSAPERARAMGARGAERVRERFSLQAVTERYARLYRAIDVMA